MRRMILAVLALFVAAHAGAQVYRWTDESGRVMYGNQPPPASKANVVQERIQSYDTAPAAAPAAQPIVMYATSWCGFCAKARAYFAKNGIPYVEHDVEKDPAARAEFRRLGGRGVPLIVQGTKVMSGFSEASFEAFRRR